MQIPGAWVDLVREVANEVLREIGTRYWPSTLNKSFWHNLRFFRLLELVKFGKIAQNCEFCSFLVFDVSEFH